MLCIPPLVHLLIPIGIYEAEALRWPGALHEKFNGGSLLDIVEDVSVGGDDAVEMAVVGQLQDSGNKGPAAGIGGTPGRLIWAHFESQSGRNIPNLDSRYPFVSVSKHTAVDILKRLVGDEDEVNYVDIYN